MKQTIIHIWTPARPMQIINPPSAMPLRLVVRLITLDLHSSALISSIITRRSTTLSLCIASKDALCSSFTLIKNVGVGDGSSIGDGLSSSLLDLLAQ